MDSNPYPQSTNFVDLLTSQQEVHVFGTQGAEASIYPQDTPAERKERRMIEEERSPGVKAAKGKKKKNVEGKETLSEFQTMWKIKQQDLVMKERLSKMRLLDSLLAKKEPLPEYEEALKKKIINELLSN
ncbi:hypothetical protein Bca52824_018257 [Brassica carinata]|uniref:No apical meristem-associated C-terminal domain-containing protein n=1 Tax=Brassica carinata TaxID=52824 RepID=A0A8X7VQL1_BRACI|nr:hypothetical protein Bca52824_018257 [Brassica carinata]